MLITKCDICKKEIKDREGQIGATVGRWSVSCSFCAPCGKPIHDFLLKKKLIEKPSPKPKTKIKS